MCLDNDAVAEVDDEFESEDVWAALAEARAAFLDPETIVAHFGFDLRGGEWTKAHTGACVDSFRATFRTKQGKEFLQEHGFNQSITFSINRYGEDACLVFCSYWVAKMDLLFALSCEDRGEGEDPFSALALSRFVEFAAFAELAETADGHVFGRIRALRDLKPI